MRRRSPSVPEELRKRPATATNVVNPRSAQPVQAGGVQSRRSSDLSQNFVVGGASTSGYAGNGSTPHGGCGPESGSLKAAPPEEPIMSAKKMTDVHRGFKNLEPIFFKIT